MLAVGASASVTRASGRTLAPNAIPAACSGKARSNARVRPGRRVEHRATARSVFGQSDGSLAIIGLDAFFWLKVRTRDRSGLGPSKSLAMRGVAEPRRARAQRADRADDSPAAPDSSGGVVDSDAHGCDVGVQGGAGIQRVSALRRPALFKASTDRPPLEGRSILALRRRVLRSGLRAQTAKSVTNASLRGGDRRKREVAGRPGLTKTP